MIIETNIGNFGNFQDLLTCMQQENHDTVNINKVEYWFAKLPLTEGHYTYQQVQNLVTELMRDK